MYKVHACVCVCSLVAGDVDGNFKQLFTRVQTIVKKNGPFEVSVVLDHAACCSGTAQSLPPLSLSLLPPYPLQLLLCVGAFFSGEAECQQQWKAFTESLQQQQQGGRGLGTA